MDTNVTAIIVTHNSQKYIQKCIDAIHQQEYSVAKIIIVDSGSDDSSYLDPYNEQEHIHVIVADNIGFSCANNLGWQHCRKKSGYTVFLNPDTFLSPQFVDKALSSMGDEKMVAAVSGKLMGFDLESGGKLTKFDSTGIFRTTYGRWFDRGQGAEDLGQYESKEIVPALCGALLFCKNEALESLGDKVFD